MANGAMGRAGDPDCLVRAFGSVSADGPERRHEALMRWATEELGLERSVAESVYALAEAETLEPWYAFQLVRCGVGVLELEAETGMEVGTADEAAQSLPPGSAEDRVRLEDPDLERRLRRSFRRLRRLMSEHADPVAAAAAFVAEPDVGRLPLG